MDLKDLKHHPSEETEEFKKVIQKVTEEARDKLAKNGIPEGQRGYNVQLNSLIHNILLKEHNIMWSDPYTYNGVMVD
jgi:hypothetical protein